MPASGPEQGSAMVSGPISPRAISVFQLDPGAAGMLISHPGSCVSILGHSRHSGLVCSRVSTPTFWPLPRAPKALNLLLLLPRSLLGLSFELLLGAQPGKAPLPSPPVCRWPSLTLFIPQDSELLCHVVWCKDLFLPSSPPQAEATVRNQTPCPSLVANHPTTVVRLYSQSLEVGTVAYPFLDCSTWRDGVGLVLECGSLRQEDHEFEASLS